jgi:hypothetical protein
VQEHSFGEVDEDASEDSGALLLLKREAGGWERGWAPNDWAGARDRGASGLQLLDPDARSQSYQIIKDFRPTPLAWPKFAGSASLCIAKPVS